MVAVTLKHDSSRCPLDCGAVLYCGMIPRSRRTFCLHLQTSPWRRTQQGHPKLWYPKTTFKTRFGLLRIYFLNDGIIFL